jgi:hypothetical protein
MEEKHQGQSPNVQNRGAIEGRERARGFSSHWSTAKGQVRDDLEALPVSHQRPRSRRETTSRLFPPAINSQGPGERRPRGFSHQPSTAKGQVRDDLEALQVSRQQPRARWETTSRLCRSAVNSRGPGERRPRGFAGQPSTAKVQVRDDLAVFPVSHQRPRSEWAKISRFFQSAINGGGPGEESSQGFSRQKSTAKVPGGKISRFVLWAVDSGGPRAGRSRGFSSQPSTAEVRVSEDLAVFPVSHQRPRSEWAKISRVFLSAVEESLQAPPWSRGGSLAAQRLCGKWAWLEKMDAPQLRLSPDLSVSAAAGNGGVLETAGRSPLWWRLETGSGG